MEVIDRLVEMVVDTKIASKFVVEPNKEPTTKNKMVIDIMVGVVDIMVEVVDMRLEVVVDMAVGVVNMLVVGVNKVVDEMAVIDTIVLVLDTVEGSFADKESVNSIMASTSVVNLIFDLEHHHLLYLHQYLSPFFTIAFDFEVTLFCQHSYLPI